MEDSCIAKSIINPLHGNFVRAGRLFALLIPAPGWTQFFGDTAMYRFPRAASKLH